MVESRSLFPRTRKAVIKINYIKTVTIVGTISYLFEMYLVFSEHIRLNIILYMLCADISENIVLTTLSCLHLKRNLQTERTGASV